MGNTDSFVKKSAEFAKDIRKIHYEEEATIVCFDICEPLHRVPLSEVLARLHLWAIDPR